MLQSDKVILISLTLNYPCLSFLIYANFTYFLEVAGKICHVAYCRFLVFEDFENCICLCESGSGGGAFVWVGCEEVENEIGGVFGELELERGWGL